MTKRIEYYSASWCQPCKVFAPVMDEFAQNNPEVEYIKVNIDIMPEKAQALGVTSIPAVYVFEGDKEIFNFTGAKPMPYLVNNIQPLL